MNVTDRVLSGLPIGERVHFFGHYGDLDRHLVPKRNAALLAAMAIATVASLALISSAIAAPVDDPPRIEDDAPATEFTLAGDTPAEWCERLKAMPNVRKLTIRRPDFKHFKAGQLKELQQLTSVRAEDFLLESPLADAVAVNLAKLPRLRSVSFDRTGLTDRGLAVLSDAKLFEYARSAMLLDEETTPIAKMVGKPAPALPMEQWIGERPDVQGKRYLIHCWAAWCGPCKNEVPLLNSLSKNRIVIGLHPSGTDMDDIRKATTDEKMAYPTVVAPPGSKDIFGYPVTVFPYCIEVDDEGKVSKHGSLHEVLGLDSEVAATAKIPPNASGAVVGTEPDSGFVAVSLGEADGVRKGRVFDAMRHDRRVAQLRIVFVSKTCSVGKVVDEKAKASVNKGDIVQRPPD